VKVEFIPGSRSFASGFVLLLLDKNGTEIALDDDTSGRLGGF